MLDGKDRVALLVDGDNVSVSFAGRLVVRAAKLGTLAIKRAYVDPCHLPNWAASTGFGLRVARQGRGAADLLLAVEAMDLAHQGGVGAFALASGDGGFAPLAQRLVEMRYPVLGLGPATTPDDLRHSCTAFEVLDRPEAKPDGARGAGSPIDALIEAVRAAVAEAPGGSLLLGLLGARLGPKARSIEGAPGPGQWRGFVEAHGDHFVAEGEGPTTRIRLR